MAAILPVCGSIVCELPTAALATEHSLCLRADKLAVCVPPFHAACVGAVPLLLAVFRLGDRRTAIGAVNFVCRQIDNSLAAQPVPLAERLDRVQGDAQRVGNAPVALSHPAHVGNLFCLCSSHKCSTS